MKALVNEPSICRASSGSDHHTYGSIHRALQLGFTTVWRLAASESLCRQMRPLKYWWVEGCYHMIVGVTGHQVNVLFLHCGADSEEKLLPNSMFVGILVVDVERHDRRRIFGHSAVADNKLLLRRHFVLRTQFLLLLSCPARKLWCRGDRLKVPWRPRRRYLCS